MEARTRLTALILPPMLVYMLPVDTGQDRVVRGARCSRSASFGIPAAMTEDICGQYACLLWRSWAILAGDKGITALVARVR